MPQANFKLPLHKTWVPGQKIEIGNRLVSMLTGHMCMAFIVMPFLIPYFIWEFTHVIKPSAAFNDAFPFPYFGMIGFALYFCKDCINGRSPAKRLLHFQVVNNKTLLAASPIRCFVRNLCCVFWIIEVPVAMINTSRRLGDFVAGTKLIYYEQDSPVKQPEINVIQLAIAFALSYALMYLMWQLPALILHFYSS